MRYMFVLCALFLVAGEAAMADVGAFNLAVDFEEQPVPELSKIANVYHGGARFIYAFAVVSGQEDSTNSQYISAYDIGYRLISPDASVVNHGFYRLNDWRSLSASETDFPEGISLPGASLPAAIGYWKLELVRGARSRGELQIIPNPANRRSAVVLVDDSGQLVSLPTRELSQDVECHGLINREFFHNEPFEVSDHRHKPGEVIASFMPGVIELNGRWGGTDHIRDPGLQYAAETYHLTGIKRLSRHAVKNPTQMLSRTGDLFTPTNWWDVYVLQFPGDTDFAEVLNAVRMLPRCVYAEPNLLVKPTGFTHLPNDSLAGDSLSWHLYRIDMPSAWDREIGNEDIHIGVLDGGVDYHLAEFGGGFGSGFKTAGGYDYAEDDGDPRVEWDDDCEDAYSIANHGNWIQSVLGALTNNDSLGVAGVAGGWGGEEGELGPSIFHFKIREDSQYSVCGRYDVGAMTEAIIDAYPVYGCLVLSISTTGGYNPALKAAIRDFHNSGGVVVATTDNRDSDLFKHYPAYYRNDWILCAQGSSRHPIDGSDTTPERRVSSEDPLYDWGADWPEPYWPIPLLSIDVCAPASHMCHIYADSLQGEKPLYYTTGSGVSFAPPQVAGVVGLMLAKNEYLQVSEIEGLVSASCADITSDDNDGYETPGSLPGWDKFTGWGRINADSCLMFADLDDCNFGVRWFTVSGGGVIVDSSTSPEIVWLLGGEDDTTLSATSYLTKWYEVRRAVTPPSGYRFAWGRPCEGAGWAWSGRTPYSDIHNYREPYCDLVPTSQYAATCTLFSYIYKVWNWNQSEYYGVHPDSAHLLDWSYGVLEDVTVSVPTRTGPETADRLRILSVAPNPGKGEIVISFLMPNPQHIDVKIYDVRGREVRTILNEDMEAGIHEKNWDGCSNAGNSVAPGVYICRLATTEEYDIRKVVLVRKGGN